MKADFIIGGVTGEGPAAKIYRCCYCQSDPWLGPASIKMLTENVQTKVICLTCYMVNPKIPQATEAETTVSSRDELVEALGAERPISW